MKNNQKIIIGAIAVLIILIIGGGGYILSSKKAKPVSNIPVQTEEVIPALTPDSIGLTLSMSSDKKKVIMEVSKTDDIDSLDYTLSYTSKGNVPRGVIGHVDVTTKGETVKKEIIMGTCSDVCHYDKDVTNIKLVLKITKTDGKVYQSEKSLGQ